MQQNAALTAVLQNAQVCFGHFTAVRKQVLTVQRKQCHTATPNRLH
jgi:hypothetical protein